MAPVEGETVPWAPVTRCPCLLHLWRALDLRAVNLYAVWQHDVPWGKT